MINSLSVYKVWAPSESIWSAWVKPVMFASSPYGDVKHVNIIVPNIDFMYNKNTMCIIDMPDEESIMTGLGLAEIGYRPIPLYNGVKGPKNAMLVDITKLEQALFLGANYLSELAIPSSANPVFLLDSRRMASRSRVPGTFDNRWSIFPQDMPSSSFLKERGINKIVLFSTTVQSDLSHILFRYQKDGIQICSSKDNKLINVKKPSRFQSYKYRFLVTLGLKRNAAGGFGGMIPDAVRHGSGRGYYGIG